MALLCPIVKVNTTTKGAFSWNKRIALTLKKYRLWKYPFEISKKKKREALTGKMKAINFQVCLFLKCGPRVTCKFKRLIFSLGIKSLKDIFPWLLRVSPQRKCSLVDKICIKNISSTVLSLSKKRLVCSFRTQIIKVTHTH